MQCVATVLRRKAHRGLAIHRALLVGMRDRLVPVGEVVGNDRRTITEVPVEDRVGRNVGAAVDEFHGMRRAYLRKTTNGDLDRSTRASASW